MYAADRSRDGFIKVNTGVGPRRETDDFNRNFYTVRAQYRWDPSDTLTLNLAADVTNRNEDCCTGVTIIRGRLPRSSTLWCRIPAWPRSPTRSAREAWSNRSTGQRIKDRGVSLQADWTTRGSAGRR